LAVEKAVELQRLERQKLAKQEIETKYKEEMGKLDREEQETRERRKRQKEETEEAERKLQEQEQIIRNKRAEERRLRQQKEEEERLSKGNARKQEEGQKGELGGRMCAACNNPITVEGVTSSGKDWHKRCFVCQQCNNEIKGLFHLRENKPLCENCMPKQNLMCSVCNKPLEGKVVRLSDRKVHSACFRCASCSASLQGGFYEKEGALVCEECSAK